MNGDGKYCNGAIAAVGETGDRQWSDFEIAANRAGVNPPKQRTAKAVAAEAVRTLKSQGFEVTPIKGQKAWKVVRPSDQTILGTASGETYLIARLVGENLECEGPDYLAERIRATWNAEREIAMISSNMVTQWWHGIVDSWQAVPTLYGRWIPPGMVERWIRLANALADIGVNVPRTPAAISAPEDIAEQMIEGLKTQLRESIREINVQVQAAKDRSGKIGAKMVSERMDELLALRQRMNFLAGMTYGIGTDDLERKISELENFLTSQLSDSEQRFEKLEFS